MPFEAPVNVNPFVPTKLGDAAVTNIRVDNPHGSSVVIKATTADVPPASQAGGVTIHARDILTADLDLVDLFPSAGAGPFWVWAFSTVATTLSVSHA